MASAGTDAGVAARSWPRGALRAFATLAAVAIAAALAWFAWRAYMGSPWTRDGTVRAYIVTIDPQVAGQIVALPTRDNQLVRKGDLLFQIDPSSYAIAARRAEAQVDQAKAVAQNAAAEWTRRQKLNDLAVTLEEQQIYAAKSLSANAQLQIALAELDNARLDLARTRVVSPVNGYVTNLLARTGDYANVGQREVSLIDADSFWVDAYFEETFLATIHDGDAATVKLMSDPRDLRGHVESLARGISVPNAAPSGLGLATVNPIFAFVRLAQRVPVRIHLDAVPADLRLVAGTTATVAIDPSPARAADATRSGIASAPGAGASPIAPVPVAGPPTPAVASTSLAAADASAAAILPALAIAAGATSGPGAPPPAGAINHGEAGGSSARPTPPASVAREEATEIASEEAFDRTLDIEGRPTAVQPPPRAPETLRRRGSQGRRHRERP
ncbi:RND family efflux transporter MFP subunit [Roseiarcus fermentans]|uniref:RND family efflux transporter MFP subunit n=1 Tax=Roseiarcus fermentans TaxID=1473586 RepID=A0A366FP95_9HYPH|nr:HlyD family secretion protein [Roseiarcus fermentans]RBP15535.1 RND family efflux transporter MFP subunit [Roseiarcus fermentans]